MSDALTPDDLILKAEALVSRLRDNAELADIWSGDVEFAPPLLRQSELLSAFSAALTDAVAVVSDLASALREVLKQKRAVHTALETAIGGLTAYKEACAIGEDRGARLSAALREAGEKNAELEAQAASETSKRKAPDMRALEAESALAAANRRIDGLVKALESAQEYFETLNEHFGRREQGLTPDNSEETMFAQVLHRLGQIDAALASTPAPAQEGAPETVPKEDWDRACRVIDAIGRNVGRMVTPDGFFADYNLHYVARNRLSAAEKTP